MKRPLTILAEIEVEPSPDTIAYPLIEIQYSFSPGQPERGPSYASGGEPAEPAEIEFISARLMDGDGLTPSQEQIETWGREWLASDSGYCAAVDCADYFSGPDPDDQRDAMLDSRS